MGRVTRDLELRHTSSGVPCINFSIATERNMINKATNKRDVDFVEMVAWQKIAELIANHFSKGSMLVAEGSLRVESWKDKDSGKQRSRMYVLVDQVYFAGSKQDGQKGSSAEPSQPCESSVGDYEEFEAADTTDLPY